MERDDNYHSVIIERQEEEPYSNIQKNCQSLVCTSPHEVECTECGKTSFAGMKEEIRRRKELLACSLQKMANTENSFIKPSRFTENVVNRAMSSENKKCGKSQEYFRTPIRKNLNFMPNECNYATK